MESLNALRSRSARATSNVVRNEYFMSIVTLLSLAYFGTFSHKLPKSVHSVLDNIVVKFIIFYSVAYIVSRKVDVALISSLAVLALVLGVQVYLSDGQNAKNGKEPMVGGFQNVVGARQAEVSFDKDGKYMENEPLNEAWTQKNGSVQGYTLDWPGYEAHQNEQTDMATMETTNSSSSVKAVNEEENVPMNGEIVGMVNTDLSHMATVN